MIVAAGLLVGFGARLGGGCTSGHGVCGIARLSKRSIAATMVFMGAAVIVVALMRHVVGGHDPKSGTGFRKRSCPGESSCCPRCSSAASSSAWGS